MSEIVEFQSRNKNVVAKTEKLRKSIDSRAEELGRLKAELESQQDAARKEITHTQWVLWKEDKLRLASQIKSLQSDLNLAQKGYRETITRLQAHCTHPDRRMPCPICDWNTLVIADSGYRLS